VSIADLVYVFGFIGIWLAQLYWMFLSVGASRYARSSLQERAVFDENPPEEWPKVTVLIPAHNEGVVIEATLRAIAAMDYPRDKYEVILINDGSTDDTEYVAQRVALEEPVIRIVNVPRGEGGKGKSRTLNVGLRYATGDLIAVYDADNTPDPDCLRYLVQALLADDRLVAVNGKVRTRNAYSTLLTRFIHIEFCFFQWVFQGGRWEWFRLSTLMGTNYVIWRDALFTLGGFDEESLVDDTEMSLRIFCGERLVRWVPYATTWEQEPDTFPVWLRQRTRWARGNFYVTRKFLPLALLYPFPLGLEMAHALLSFVFFLPALAASHSIFFLGLTDLVTLSIPGPFQVLWGLSFGVFIAQIWFALSMERQGPQIYLLAVFSYFTYSQLFIPVTLRALFLMTLDTITRREVRWDKTQRTQENP